MHAITGILVLFGVSFFSFPGSKEAGGINKPAFRILQEKSM